MNIKRVLLVLGGLVFLAALVAGGILFIQNNEQLWNPYYRAALEIEAAYGEYVDVTYIGPVKGRPEILAYFVIIKTFMPEDDIVSPGYYRLLSETMARLVKDETVVLYVLLYPGNPPQVGMIAEFDAQAVKSGTELFETIKSASLGRGTPKANPYLKWMDN